MKDQTHELALPLGNRLYYPLVVWSHLEPNKLGCITFKEGQFVRSGNMNDEEVAEVYAFHAHPATNGNSDIRFDCYVGFDGVEDNFLRLTRDLNGGFVREASHPVDDTVWTLLEAISDRLTFKNKH